MEWKLRDRITLIYHITSIETYEELKQKGFLAFIRNCTYIKATSNVQRKTSKYNFAVRRQWSQNYKYSFVFVL